MSLPSWTRNEIIRTQEAAEAATPYDPSVATKVILRQPPTDPNPQRTAVWDSNPWDRFDRKVVLAYTGNQDRIRLLQTEFARVGLNDVHVHWNTPNRFIARLFATETQNTFLGRPYKFSIYNNAFGHYSIIKEAYELGIKSCLIMEDDIRFLRDINQIRSLVDELPDAYDCALLDSHPLHDDQITGKMVGDKVTSHWRTCIERTSAACYALNRSGMKKMIEHYEKSQFCSSDMYFKTDVFGSKIIYSDPCIARQTRIDTAATNSSYDSWSQLYDKIGCPRRNYGK